MSQQFSQEIELPVGPAEAFQWHERPGALERLIPPWEKVKIIRQQGGIEEGGIVELLTSAGPLRSRWLAEHSGYVFGEKFEDTQTSGPFARWYHQHLFRAHDGGSVLEDKVEYKLPLAAVSQLVFGGYVRKQIERMFDYRQRTTLDDITAHHRYAEKGTMRIAVTGSSGLVGSQLLPFLTTGGHEALRVVRRDAKAKNEISWQPSKGEIDKAALEGVDAIVNLAGESIAEGRWTEEKKKRIRESRVDSTRTIAEAIASMDNPPKVLVNASAIGFYGDRGDEILDEDKPAGEGFLSEVCEDWEAAATPAEEAGIRVVKMRIGVVLSPKGGALAKMLPPFKLGGGGRMGSGKQYWSWIALDDLVGAIHHAIMTESLSGPVNATAPEALTNAEFTKVLGRVLKRPTIFPMPAFAAKLVLGEMAEALLLSSARVVPKRLEESGYGFRFPTLEAALRHLLGAN